MQRLLTILLLIILPTIAASQSQFRFKHLTTNEGLSQNSVYTIYQDSIGFLWFGTQDGLNRFDGVSFKVYRHRDDDTTSISDNYILKIVEDKSNNLWIGTRNGANRFDKATETFTRYYFPELFENDYHQVIQEIIVDDDGNVIILLPDGLYSFSPRDNFRTPRRLCTFKTENQGIKVVQDKEHTFWVTTSKGLICLSMARPERRVTFYPYPPNVQVSGFMVMQNNRLWISAGEGLESFSLESRTFQHLSLEHATNNAVRYLYVDSQQRIWVTTDEKIILLTETSDVGFQQKIIQRKEGDFISLNDVSVLCVFQDRTGLYWLGTAHGGVNLYDPLQMHFKTIGESMLKTLPTVWAICEDTRKILWFGTSSGLVKATRRDTSKAVTSYQSIEDAFDAISIVPMNGIPKQITSLLEDDEHQLLLGIKGNGVVRYNVEKNTFIRYVHSEEDTNSLINNSILSMRKLSNGEIWICTFGGVSILNLQNHTFRNLLLTSFDSSMTNYVLDVYEASDSILWFSTSNGAVRYDRGQHSMVLYQHKENDNRTLRYNIATTCSEDASKNLWVATLGGGLNMFDNVSKSFSHVTTIEGLQNDVVYSICKDAKHSFWLSTNEGLSRFSTEPSTFTPAVTNFGLEEGLQFKEFALNSCFQNNAGEMFFGGVGGVVVFHPDSVSGNSFIPPIVISDLKINYKSLDSLQTAIVLGSSTMPREIHLSYLEKALTLEFVALNFRNAQNNIYQYKLEGFDDHWIVPEPNQRVAHYTNLPSGEFTFIVKASNNSGVWNNEGLRITIIVFPPFWLSWWFISIVSTIVLGAVVFSVRSYSHRKLRRKLVALEIQRKIQSDRERISRDLHDNVGSQLVNIISGLDIAGRYSETSSEKTKSLLVSLQVDARTSMGLLRQTIWALKTNELTLEQFITELEHYVRKQCNYYEEISFQCTMNIAHPVILSPIQVLNVFRITQEALTNIFKYAHAHHIHLSCTLAHPDHFTLTIKDDGIGLQEQSGDMLNGNGKLNMERRAKELGGTIQWIDENGTAVELMIPL